MLVAASTASGQHYQPFGELDMHYDLQLFAPPIIDEYGDEPVVANYGWFADYNRAYLKLSRPDNLPSHFQEDGTWGNIWNIGYMTEENHGWLMSILNINRTNVAQFTAVTDIQGNEFILQNNLNAGQYNGFEINKTFRAHVGQHGAYFEPFGGFRYANFKEDLLTQTLVVDDPAFPLVEVATGTRGIVHNNMFGGQIGLRSYMRRGYWIISSEIRAFGQVNYQEASAVQTQVVTIDDGLGGFLVQNPVITRSDEDFQEFVVGGELRVGAAYELTREVRINAGLELLHLGRGIGRGFDEDLFTSAFVNDGAATYAGFFFGFEVNR